MLKYKREMLDKINNIDEHCKKLEAYGTGSNGMLNSLLTMVKSLFNENQKLSKDVQTLTAITQGNLGEASNCELLVIKSYRNEPVIYKDGKLISSDNMEDVTIRYSKGEPVRVEIES